MPSNASTHQHSTTGSWVLVCYTVADFVMSTCRSSSGLVLHCLSNMLFKPCAIDGRLNPGILLRCCSLVHFSSVQLPHRSLTQPAVCVHQLTGPRLCHVSNAVQAGVCCDGCRPGGLLGHLLPAVAQPAVCQRRPGRPGWRVPQGQLQNLACCRSASHV